MKRQVEPQKSQIEAKIEIQWALADNQADPAEVERALKEAFLLCGETVKAILAELHVCAGHAYAVLGNTAESNRHFKCATEIEPVGNYGRLSRSVWATINPEFPLARAG